MSNGGNDRLRALAALALSETRPDGPCPPDEELAAWHDRALETADEHRVAAHVAHCERCHTLYAGWLEIEAAAPVAAMAATPRASWLRRFFAGLATPRVAGAAATLLLAGLIGIGVWQYDGKTTGLPAYELALEGKLIMRGDAPPAAAVVRFDQGNAFTLLLRPQDAVADELEIRAYQLRDGKAEALQAPPPRIAASGAVMIDGEIGSDVLLPGGPSEILIVLGRQGQLPTPAALVRALRTQTRVQKSDWTAWRIAVNVDAVVEP